MKQYVKVLCEAVYPDGNSTPSIEPMSLDAARLILRLRATIEARDNRIAELKEQLSALTEKNDAMLKLLQVVSSRIMNDAFAGIWSANFTTEDVNDIRAAIDDAREE